MIIIVWSKLHPKYFAPEVYVSQAVLHSLYSAFLVHAITNIKSRAACMTARFQWEADASFFVMARTRWQQLSTISLRHESHMWSNVALTSSLPLWPSSAACGCQIAGGGHSRPAAKPGVSLHTHCEPGQPWSVRLQFDNGFFPCTWIFVPGSMTSLAFYIF